MTTKKDTTVDYTVKEIVEKIHTETQAQSLKLDAINTQVQLTNGRVTKLEKQSLGAWIYSHPFKSAIILTGTILCVISDFRQPILESIFKFVTRT